MAIIASTPRSNLGRLLGCGMHSKGNVRRCTAPTVRRSCASIFLLGEAALFISRYDCNYPVAPSDFDRAVWGYRLAQTAFLGDLYCTVVLVLLLFPLPNRPVRSPLPLVFFSILIDPKRVKEDLGAERG